MFGSHPEAINTDNNQLRRIFMNKILSGIFLGTLLTIASSAIAAGTDTDPVIGTWKLNVAKSTFAAAQAPKAQTRVYTQSAQGLTLNMKTTEADGKESTTMTTYHLDGKDYPATGSPDYDALSGKQIDANTAEFTLKRAGKAVGTTRRTASKDGKTLTATGDLTDAKGVQSKELSV
jgi:hypothetical protein